MARNIISVIAGLAAAIAIFLIAEQVNSSLHPAPLGIDFSKIELLKDFYANQPMSFWLMVLAGWALGSLVCGYLIKLISRNDKKTLPLIAGSILTLSGVANIFSLPHPTWFIIVGLLIFIPFVLFGHSLYRPKNIAQ